MIVDNVKLIIPRDYLFICPELLKQNCVLHFLKSNLYSTFCLQKEIVRYEIYSRDLYPDVLLVRLSPRAKIVTCLVFSCTKLELTSKQ